NFYPHSRFSYSSHSFPTEIIDLSLHDALPIFNDIHLSAVQEAMNQMMGAAATSMSTVFEKKVDISPPSIELKQDEEDIPVEKMTEKQVLVKVSFQLKVGELIDSYI